ncbi:Hint domain-containing protein [Acetobacter fallax]|uniref:Glycosyltransferase n=1 Tax=Acetobacter fallax TaxID=1737473 RepID=A0ABX0K7S5_9PROT|nr:Hint domain-containing protein [Acetobacter fallax]NHO31812.1 glycosyltransferase [Acetobacter fallax]NHO35425.1 glycosyltransferase [Acetobacter fallax]
MTTTTVNTGTQTNQTVSSGDTLKIIDTAVVSGLTVNSGGTAYVSSGGVVSGITLISGGSLFVGITGNASPGTEGTVSGGTVSGGSTGSGGFAVENGATISDVTMTSGTSTVVWSQGTARNMIIDAGASENVYGTDTGAMLSSGTGNTQALQTVAAGGIASGATVLGNALQTINAGGSAVDTTLSGTGFSVNQAVTSGGYASNTTILSGGQQQVQGSGSSYDVTIGSGGLEDVQSGGTLSGIVVGSGGSATLEAGASVSNVTISSSGYVDILDLDGVNSTINGITVENGGTLEIGGLDDTLTNLSLVKGATLQIDLDPTQYSVSYSDSAITILDSSGKTVDTISLASPVPGFDAADFSSSTVTTDSSGDKGMQLSYIACYCPGTRIAVQDGEAAIETLEIGDLVRTASGELRPVRWIGRRSYAPEFVGKNKKLLPVTIKAGAIADNIPQRDLRVSPLHAMYVDGVLVPASALINGISIVQDEEPGEVAYIHLELESHDLLLAEGAPSETYVEDGSRGMFQNAADYYARYPDAKREEAIYCAPRVEGGEHLAKIWRQLAERARPHGAGTVPVHAGYVDLAALCAQAAGTEPSHHQEPSPHRPVTTENPEAGDRPEKTGRFHGWLDFASRNRLNGWAWNEDRPWERMQVDVFVDGHYITTICATSQRPDLASAGIGNGWAAFELTFGTLLDPATPHVIEVRHAGTDHHLHGSPKHLSVAGDFNDDMEAFVERAVAGLETDEERRRALAFVTRQAERISQQKADHDTRREERAELERSRRLAGRAAADIPKLRRALVIDEQFPRVGCDAGSQAIYSHIRTLGRLGYQVTFVSPAANIPQDLIAAMEAEGVSVACAPFYQSPEDVLRRQAGTFDVVYLHRVSIASSYAGLVRRYMGGSRVIYSVADLHYLRMARQAGIEGNTDLAYEAGRTRTLEVTAALMSDVVITHSGFEASELRRLMPALNVHVVPWDIAPQPVRKSASERHGVAFLGNYSHGPNRDAAEWLVSEVMPRVWQQAPEIRCILAGSDADADIEDLAREADASCGGVHIAGRIENLRDDLFENVRLGVAPLRFGAGIKGKVLETFAAGLPCVMSPMAAEGIDLPADLSDLVQKDAGEIAAQIVRLHQDPDMVDTLGQAGSRLIRGKFSEGEVSRTLAGALGRPEAALEAMGPFSRSA